MGTGGALRGRTREQVGVGLQTRSTPEDSVELRSTRRQSRLYFRLRLVVEPGRQVSGQRVILLSGKTWTGFAHAR
jgi:hypothetical protein